LIPAEHETVLNFRWPIDLGLTVASHGWVYLAPWRWDAAAGCLAGTENIGNRLGTVEIVQRHPGGVIVGWEGFGADEAEVPSRVNVAP
jgi:hypothetical protein